MHCCEELFTVIIYYCEIYYIIMKKYVWMCTRFLLSSTSLFPNLDFVVSFRKHVLCHISAVHMHNNNNTRSCERFNNTPFLCIYFMWINVWERECGCLQVFLNVSVLWRSVSSGRLVGTHLAFRTCPQKISCHVVDDFGHRHRVPDSSHVAVLLGVFIVSIVADRDTRLPLDCF